MRILHLVHQYLPENIGGTELYTKWLTEGLSQRGHEISVYYRRSAEGNGLDYRQENGCQIWTGWDGVLSPTSRFLTTFSRQKKLVNLFQKVLDQTQPEIVHIEHLMGHPTGLIWAIQQREIPFVITLWDFWWICANAQLLTNYSQEVCDGPNLFLNCARCALARSGVSQFWPTLPWVGGLLAWRNHLLGQIIGAADRLIAPTQFVREWYIDHGIPASKLVVIPPGLQPPPNKVAAHPASNTFRFAYIGGLSPQKGVHVLLEAFNKLDTPAELWIGGDEKADPEYVARLKKQSSTKVRFLGQLSRSQVWETLAQVNVLVVPSLWYETFAFVVSEAFAAGVPVIASQLGPLADRVRDEIDGLLVNPGDVEVIYAAMNRLLHDSDLLTQLKKGIRPPHTIEEHVKEIEDLYQTVRQKSANRG